MLEVRGSRIRPSKRKKVLATVTEDGRSEDGRPTATENSHTSLSTTSARPTSRSPALPGPLLPTPQSQQLGYALPQPSGFQAMPGEQHVFQEARSEPSQLPSQLATPSGDSTTSATSQQQQQTTAATSSYLGSSSFIPIFLEAGTASCGDEQAHEDPKHENLSEDLPSPLLRHSYLETYHRYCYVWCPILDRPAPDDPLPAYMKSPLVQHALALIGTHVEPPVMSHDDPAVHYERAKSLFNGNHETNPLLAVSAVMLFYWWGHGPPNIVSIDTVWWWTGVAIRQAQQLGLHRELKPGQPLLLGETPGLRRRIWWTLFARERLSSICTGRPAMINPEDCNVRPLTLNDFPGPNHDRAEIFIYWVRLCDVIGRLNSHLIRRSEATPFPSELVGDLRGWVASLPPRLLPPINGPYTTSLDIDVHHMHLHYLTAVVLLHLRGTPHALPTAYMNAVLAACCVARICEDFLSRNSLRFLQGVAGWCISVSILALLYARRAPRLTRLADAHIQVMRAVLRELAKMWHSSRMFDEGFEKLITGSLMTTSFGPKNPSDHQSLLSEADTQVADGSGYVHSDAPPQSPVPDIQDLVATENWEEWRDYFPFLTAETSPLAARLLQPAPTPALAEVFDWPVDLTLDLQGFFEPFGDLSSSIFMQ
ncbi:C6 transcription factor [Niveomyces insectorum RCEF 264]|uniref:C6 transcription factor n=1 Tax=Niveomyces insectorum RCEF 264 TaxID=1081102 RepID=A0A167T425_9HYPO|nr:C6 transcription factor [Niveomyces insectorum RCEF 264]